MKLLMENWRKFLKEAAEWPSPGRAPSTEPEWGWEKGSYEDRPRPDVLDRRWRAAGERGQPEPKWSHLSRAHDIVNTYIDMYANSPYHTLVSRDWTMIGWAPNMDRWEHNKASEHVRAAKKREIKKREELRNELAETHDEEVEDYKVSAYYVGDNFELLEPAAWTETIGSITDPPLDPGHRPYSSESRGNWAREHGPVQLFQRVHSGTQYKPTAKEWYLGTSTPKEWIEKAKAGVEPGAPVEPVSAESAPEEEPAEEV